LPFPKALEQKARALIWCVDGNIIGIGVGFMRKSGISCGSHFAGGKIASGKLMQAFCATERRSSRSRKF